MSEPKPVKASVDVLELTTGQWRVTWEHEDHHGAKRRMSVDGRSLAACLAHVAEVLDGDRKTRRRAGTS